MKIKANDNASKMSLLRALCGQYVHLTTTEGRSHACRIERAESALSAAPGVWVAPSNINTSYFIPLQEIEAITV